MSFIPAYLVFALALMLLSAAATRALGWRAPSRVDVAIAELEWPLLDWMRYLVSIHLVRVFAGTLFRATPLWSFYMRLNGARLGRRVYVNSLSVTDHNLLEFGDDVVIGEGAHVSGHTIEGGRLKTAPVRLGSQVTIGLQSIVGIGVEAGWAFKWARSVSSPSSRSSSPAFTSGFPFALSSRQDPDSTVFGKSWCKSISMSVTGLSKVNE